MMENLWACEEVTLRAYLERTREAALKGVSGPTIQSPDILSVVGSTAHVGVRGMLLPRRANLIEQLLGIDVTSYDDIASAMALAADSPDIERIVLDVDSPGGQISGVERAAGAVASAAASKPVVAINHGTMASAAYWLASQASEIYAASPSAVTGSIGVVVVMRGPQEGTVEITSSGAPRKRPDVSTPEGVGVVRERLDAIERIFVDAVARGRGVSTQHVRDTFGGGGMLIAADPDSVRPDAVSVGMLDGVLTQTGRSTPKGGDMDLQAKLAELEAMLASALADRDALQARVDSAARYLTSAYPKQIHALAAKVLSGDLDPKALEGAVLYFDAVNAKEDADVAASESAALPETPAEPKSMSNDVASLIAATRAALKGGEA